MCLVINSYNHNRTTTNYMESELVSWQFYFSDNFLSSHSNFYLQRYWFQKSGLKILNLSYPEWNCSCFHLIKLSSLEICWKEQHTELNFLMMINSTLVVYFSMLCTFSFAYFLSLSYVCVHIMFSCNMRWRSLTQERIFVKIWKYGKYQIDILEIMLQHRYIHFDF